MKRRIGLIIGCGVGALVTLGVLGAAAFDDQLFGNVTAAWLQAVGSIWAIVAAILVADATSRRQERWLEQEAKERISSRRDAVAYAADVLGQVIDYLESLPDPAPHEGHLLIPEVTSGLERADRLLKHYLASVESAGSVALALVVAKEEIADIKELMVGLRRMNGVTTWGVQKAVTQVLAAKEEVDFVLGQLDGR